MNRIYLIMTIVLSTVILSCSQKNNLRHAASKKAYMTHLQQLSGADLEKQLERDGAYLSSLLDSLAGFELYYSVGFSFGGGSEESTVDAAPEFVLPTKEVVTADLNNPKRKLYFDQALAQPESDFTFSGGYHEEGFEQVAVKDLHMDMQTQFANGKPVQTDNLALMWMDSVQVKATYRFPVQFDTLVLNLTGNKAIQYEGDTIYIDYMKGKEASFRVPLELSAKIMDYRGITPDGVLIASNSFSKFPLTGIDASVTEELRALSTGFAEKNKDAVMQQLEENPEDPLHYIQQLDALYADYIAYENKEFEDDFAAVDYMKTMLEKHQDVLGVNDMQYALKFPSDVTEIHLYVAQAYDTLSRNFTAVNLLEERPAYTVYLDKEKRQYGIVDANREIVIPAAYDELNRRSDLFFTERDKATFTTYRLDHDKKTMTALPKGLDFFDLLPGSNHLYLFHNEDRYVGVLDQDLNEIIPFRFAGGEQCGNVLVMNASHRGRPYKAFFTLEGKEISIPEKVVQADCKGDFILLTTREKKTGVLNHQGELTVPFNYDIDRHYGSLSDKLVAYRISREDEKEGIINVQTGEIILPAEKGFHGIGRFYEGFATAGVISGYDRFVGYIDEEGRIVIEPKFSAGTPFYRGMACVKDRDDKIHLINKQGQIVKTFPDVVSEGDSYYVSNYGRQIEFEDRIYYEINSRLYDEKGDLLPQAVVDKITEADKNR